MQKIILTGNPISTSHIYLSQGKRRFMTKKAKDRKKQYQLEAKSQWKKNPLTTDTFIDIILYFGDKRKRDWDNFHKLSMDSLEGIVLQDDAQIQEATVHKEYDKENPRIEIFIHS